MYFFIYRIEIGSDKQMKKDVLCTPFTNLVVNNGKHTFS